MPVVDLDLLDLSPARPKGRIPRPSAALLRRIEGHGIIEPVVVRPRPGGRYEVLVNAETVVAAGRLSMHQVPVTVLDDIDDQEAAEIVSDYVDPAGEDNPIDVARALQKRVRQIGRHGAITLAASEQGISRAQAANYLRILTLPENVQTHMRAGRLSLGHAKALLMAPPTRRSELAEKTVNRGWSVRRVTAEAREDNATASATPPASRSSSSDAKNPDVLRLEREISELIGCTFRIEQGRAVIDFYNNYEILDGVLERLGHRRL